MTVKELMGKLVDLPQDGVVVVEGYEGGLDEVSKLDVLQIEMHPNPKWWHGKYSRNDKSVIQAVFMGK